MRSSNKATVSARASSSASSATLLLPRLEVPGPGLCMRADAAVPPRTDRALATLFVLDEGVGERAGGAREGDVDVGSTDGRRPGAVPTGGFFVAADIMIVLI